MWACRVAARTRQHKQLRLNCQATPRTKSLVIINNIQIDIFFVFLKTIPFVITESEVDSEDEEDEVQSSSDSSSSSGESPSCPICLLKFKGQALGFPDACEHPFCLDCILEWSKVSAWKRLDGTTVSLMFASIQNVKTCPNDRRQFENILVRLDLEGKVVRKIPVAAPAKVAEEVSVFEITLCQVNQ